MKFLAVAVFFAAVAYTSASAIGLPLLAGRGALEGALGGQWIPDVPVATAPHAAPLAGLWGGPLLGAPALATPGLAAPGLVADAARDALEGALGGQWIPDVLPGI